MLDQPQAVLMREGYGSQTRLEVQVLFTVSINGCTSPALLIRNNTDAVYIRSRLRLPAANGGGARQIRQGAPILRLRSNELSRSARVKEAARSGQNHKALELLLRT